MDKKKRYEYIFSPATVVSLLVAIFWFWVTRWTLNYRISRLEDFQKEVNLVEIQSTLAQIQVDLQWVKNTLAKVY